MLCQKSWLWNHLALKLHISFLGGSGTVEGSQCDDEELIQFQHKAVVTILPWHCWNKAHGWGCDFRFRFSGRQEAASTLMSCPQGWQRNKSSSIVLASAVSQSYHEQPPIVWFSPWSQRHAGSPTVCQAQPFMLAFSPSSSLRVLPGCTLCSEALCAVANWRKSYNRNVFVEGMSFCSSAIKYVAHNVF